MRLRPTVRLRFDEDGPRQQHGARAARRAQSVMHAARALWGGEAISSGVRARQRVAASGAASVAASVAAAGALQDQPAAAPALQRWQAAQLAACWAGAPTLQRGSCATARQPFQQRPVATASLTPLGLADFSRPSCPGLVPQRGCRNTAALTPPPTHAHWSQDKLTHSVHPAVLLAPPASGCRRQIAGRAVSCILSLRCALLARRLPLPPAPCLVVPGVLRPHSASRSPLTPRRPASGAQITRERRTRVVPSRRALCPRPGRRACFVPLESFSEQRLATSVPPRRAAA